MDRLNWREVLHKLAIVSFVFGAAFIYRHGEKRNGYTIRRTLAEKTGLLEIERLMAWERVVARGEDEAILRRSALQAATGCRLEANYLLEGGNWAPSSQKLLVDHPFRMQLEAPGWALELLARCDGKKTGEELFESLKQQKVVPYDTPFRTLAGVLTVMVSGGYVEIPAHAPSF